MGDFPSFERLIETAGLIARHPDYPGKRRLVEECRWEFEALVVSGRINPAQAEVLSAILRGELDDSNVIQGGRSLKARIDRPDVRRLDW